MVSQTSRSPSGATAHLVLGDARFFYYPLWETGRNDVFCYLCEAVWDAGGDHPLAEVELQSEFGDSKRLEALDLETLNNAITHVEEVAGQYGFFNVLIPVHFSTLENPTAAEIYTNTCNARAWSVIDSIHYEIISPPAKFSQEQLATVAGQVMPFGRGTMLRVEPGFDQFEDLVGENFLSVGLGLRANQLSKSETLSELKRFTSRARGNGIECHVHGLTSVPLSVAAVNAGFDFAIS